MLYIEWKYIIITSLLSGKCIKIGSQQTAFKRIHIVKRIKFINRFIFKFEIEQWLKISWYKQSRENSLRPIEIQVYRNPNAYNADADDTSITKTMLYKNWIINFNVCLSHSGTQIQNDLSNALA